MSSGLLEKFRIFINSVYSRLEDQGPIDITGAMFNINDARIIQQLVEDLESKVEFQNLVTETKRIFKGKYHVADDERTWRDAMRVFFCRSGYYLDMIAGKPLNIDASFSNYYDAFKQREAQITYLCPLEYVYFDQSLIDLDTFRIKRFSPAELSDILQNNINSIFYRWAAITPERIRLLSQYWFLEVQHKEASNQLGYIRLPSSWATDVVFRGYAEREYTDFPKPVESALYPLCLYDWPSVYRNHRVTETLSHKKDRSDIWLKFDIPFTIKISNDLLIRPGSLPIQIHHLATIPRVDPNTGKVEDEEEPERYLWLDEKQTFDCIEYMKKLNDIFSTLDIDETDWSFLKTSLCYYTKAFFLQPGLDQLLWRITALEALLLLDEEREGMTSLLARRLSYILGKDGNERGRITKNFRQLYSVRSSLVHGKVNTKAHITGLINAYRFSRLAILWFLHCVSSIDTRDVNSEVDKLKLTQKDLLKLIDVGYERDRLSKLMEHVPKAFPYVNEWIS